MKIYETKHMSFFWTTFRVFGVCTQIQLELRCASHTHVLCSRCYSSPVYTNMEKLSLFPYWRSQRKKKEGHRVVEIKETKRNNTFWCNTHSSFKAHFVSPNLQIICLWSWSKWCTHCKTILLQKYEVKVVHYFLSALIYL